MALTMAEKLFTRNNLAGKAVRAGDFVDARIDGAMCHYHAGEPMLDMAREAGFKDGLPRVWDRRESTCCSTITSRRAPRSLPDENAHPQGGCPARHPVLS
jgi:hypothetical protein